MDDCEKLLHAIDRMLIGGNHIANVVRWDIPYKASHEEAHMMCLNQEQYEIWVAWKCIMESRDYLEENGLIK